MKIAFHNSFERQIDKTKDQKLLNNIAKIVQLVREAETLKDISNLKKMKGHQTAYRIRIGNSRIGFYFIDETVFFAVIAHRKKIYQIFP